MTRALAVSLAAWAILAAFAAFPFAATGGPPHFVGGGVLGPGNDVSPGPTNPANSADLVFYSKSNLSHALLVGADSYSPANGVDPALFLKDIGAWDWADGDDVTAVVETQRGVNGWNGANHTTSLDGTLVLGNPSQDIGDGTLELLPTIALQAGVDFVNVMWTGLRDDNGNVDSYEVYRGPNAGAVTTSVGRVVHVALAARSFNNTALNAGTYCYNLAVNYDRGGGNVHETMGRSEVQCASVTGQPPRIVSTVPANTDTGVSPTADIVVTFSEPMDTVTVTHSISPTIGLTPSWSALDTVLTLTHTTSFTDCVSYTARILTGQDLDGNNLVAGAPNPWTFTANCPAPYILSTSPLNLATQVRRDATIRVVFSEAMNTTSIVPTFLPSVTIATETWNSPANTTYTFTVSDFVAGQLYNVTIIGRDIDDLSLVAGPVPNPWEFTINTPPDARIDPLLTLLGVCRTGGFGLDIPWTMVDEETSAANLVVWLNYTIGATTAAIAGPLTGLSPPFQRTWTPSNTLNGDATIFLEVADEVGEKGQSISSVVKIDSTAPGVSGFSPTEGQMNVATNAPVIITFSERMSATATQGAVVISPSPATTPTPSWDPTGTVLTLTATFQVNLTYRVTVGTGARDACSPGLALPVQRTVNFTTGAGPKVPNPPTGLAVSSSSSSAISLTWTRPTTYSDNSPFALSDVQEYEVYRATSPTGTRTLAGTSPSTSFTDTAVSAGQYYYYWVKVIDTQGRASDYSNRAEGRAGASPDGGISPWVYLIPVVAVILLVLGLWLLRRKKPAEAPLGPGAKVQGAPPTGGEAVAGAPPEAGTSTEGAGFVSCPNCGTMVKPTDAECFVCGAKL